jgi:hypothetical protein
MHGQSSRLHESATWHQMQPPTTAKIIRNVNSHMCLYEVKFLTTRMNIL